VNVRIAKGLSEKRTDDGIELCLSSMVEEISADGPPTKTSVHPFDVTWSRQRLGSSF
jgi:hypothetical protein